MPNGGGIDVLEAPFLSVVERNLAYGAPDVQVSRGSDHTSFWPGRRLRIRPNILSSGETVLVAAFLLVTVVLFGPLAF